MEGDTTQRKNENIVKIFLDALLEDSNVSDDKTSIEAIARTLTNTLASQLDPSKKEFREKVNFLKMKLKGSRNNFARQALLKGSIKVDEFIALPVQQHSPEYFQDVLNKDKMKGQSAGKDATPPVGTTTTNSNIGIPPRATGQQPRAPSRPPVQGRSAGLQQPQPPKPLGGKLPNTVQNSEGQLATNDGQESVGRKHDGPQQDGQSQQQEQKKRQQQQEQQEISNQRSNGTKIEKQQQQVLAANAHNNKNTPVDGFDVNLPNQSVAELNNHQTPPVVGPSKDLRNQGNHNKEQKNKADQDVQLVTEQIKGVSSQNSALLPKEHDNEINQQQNEEKEKKKPSKKQNNQEQTLLENIDKELKTKKTNPKNQAQLPVQDKNEKQGIEELDRDHLTNGSKSKIGSQKQSKKENIPKYKIVEETHNEENAVAQGVETQEVYSKNIDNKKKTKETEGQIKDSGKIVSKEQEKNHKQKQQKNTEGLIVDTNTSEKLKSPRQNAKQENSHQQHATQQKEKQTETQEQQQAAIIEKQTLELSPILNEKKDSNKKKTQELSQQLQFSPSKSLSKQQTPLVISQQGVNFEEKNGGYANPFGIVVRESHKKNLSKNLLISVEDELHIEQLKTVVTPSQLNQPLKQMLSESSGLKIVKGTDDNFEEDQDNEDRENMGEILKEIREQEEQEMHKRKECEILSYGETKQQEFHDESQEQMRFQDENSNEEELHSQEFNAVVVGTAIQHEFSIPTEGLRQENATLKGRLCEVLREWENKETGYKREINRMQLKMLQTETSRREASGEAKQLKDYIDKMIEQNSTCKTSYAEIAAIFEGTNNADTRRQNNPFNEQQLTSELKNCQAQLRQAKLQIELLTQNNQQLNSALDNLHQDLLDKDVIISHLNKLNSIQILPQQEKQSVAYSNNCTDTYYSQSNHHNQHQEAADFENGILPEIAANQILETPAYCNNGINLVVPLDSRSNNNNSVSDKEATGLRPQAQLDIDLDALQTPLGKVDCSEAKQQALKNNNQQNKNNKSGHFNFINKNNDTQQEKYEDHHQQEKYCLEKDKSIEKNSKEVKDLEEHQNHDVYSEKQQVQFEEQNALETDPSKDYQHRELENAGNMNLDLHNNNHQHFVDQDNPFIEETTPQQQQESAERFFDGLQPVVSKKLTVMHHFPQHAQEEAQWNAHNNSESNFFDINQIPNSVETRNLKASTHTFLSNENEFFKIDVSDKFNTSNISAIPNPFNSNHFFFNHEPVVIPGINSSNNNRIVPQNSSKQTQLLKDKRNRNNGQIPKLFV